MTAKVNKLKQKVEKSISYRIITDYEENEKFYDKFFRKLQSLLSKNFGPSVTSQIFTLLNEKQIELLNPKVFFLDTLSDVDPSKESWALHNPFKTYAINTTFNCKKLMEEGYENITLSYFVLNYALTVEKERNEEFLEVLLYSLATIRGKRNPVTIRLIDPKLVEGKIGTEKYNEVCKNFIRRYSKVRRMGLKKGLVIPNLEVIFSIQSLVREEQYKCIANHLNLGISTVNVKLRDINPLIKENPQLQGALEAMANVECTKQPDINKLMDDLQEIYDKREYFVKSRKVFQLGVFKKLPPEVRRIYVERDLYNERVKNIVAVEIAINGSKVKKDNLEAVVDCAYCLAVLKQIYDKADPDTTARLIMREMGPPNSETIKKLYLLQKKLRSKYNRNVIIEIQYTKKEVEDLQVVSERNLSNSLTHIRIISDIHADINERNNYSFDFGDDFVVNCGDTSGDSQTTFKWVRENMKTGVFVNGNHLGYTMPYPELNNTPETLKTCRGPIHRANTLIGQQAELEKLSHLEKFHFLNRNSISFTVSGKKVLFIGACLYSNFKVFGEDKAEACENYAAKGLNDFRYVYSNTRAGATILTPEIYKRMYTNSYNSIISILLKNRGKTCILVTHFPPVPFAIAPQYKNDPLSAAFANDMRKVFKDFPNIRLAVFGHTHVPCDFLYENTRFVCCPFGYNNENNYDIKNYGTRIALADIVSEEPWENLVKGIKRYTDEDWLPLEK